MDKRYQVFISSTYNDLQDERKAAVEGILEQNCFPSGMELFPASDLSQFEFIKKVIDESDYYLLISAGKYGTIGNGGKSYTEMEYDYALEIGVPILTILHKDIQNLQAKLVESDDDGKRRLEEFRSKVKEGKMCDFYTNCDNLKAKVASSLSKAIRMTPRVGWIRGNMGNNPFLLEQLKDLNEENRVLKSSIEALTSKVAFQPEDGIANFYDEIRLKIFIEDFEYGDVIGEHCNDVCFTLKEYIDIYGYTMMNGFSFDQFNEKMQKFLDDLIYDSILSKDKRRYDDYFSQEYTISEKDIYSILYHLEYLKIISADNKDSYNLTDYGKSLVRESILFKKNLL